MNYASQPIGEFLSGVASGNVTPAGGTAAAVVGATGASLCEMVCIHTIEYGTADRESELADVRDDLATLRGQLLELADADARAVEAVVSAAPDPDPDTDSGPGSDDDNDGLTETKRATGVPLTIATACLDVLENATVVTEKGSQNAVPDGVTGALLAHSALRATVFTVRANAGRIPDAAFAEEMQRRATEVERAGERAYEAVTGRREEHLTSNQ